MKNLTASLRLAMGLAVVCGAPVLAATASAAQKVESVKVVNTTAEPVPTTAVGVTSVTGTVQAQQSGTWQVGVTSLPAVQVGNAINAPVPTISVNDGREPVQMRLTLNIATGSSQAQAEIEVPAGKRLVIEHASSRAQGPTGQGFIAQIQTSVFANESTRGVHWLVLHNQGTFSGIDVFTASQPMRVYADPSTPPVQFIVTRTTVVGSAFAEVTLSGYLVDLP
jgi:hypothetical protein